MPDLAQLEPYLNRRLLGQREAIGEFSSAIVRAENGPKRPGRTKAFMLLLGPTGTGKTEMVNLTAQFLYGADAPVRLEVGEFEGVRLGLVRGGLPTSRRSKGRRSAPEVGVKSRRGDLNPQPSE